MKSRTSQQGSTARIVIVVILVVALLGALGYIFWQNFVQKDQVMQGNTSQLVEQKPTDMQDEKTETQTPSPSNETAAAPNGTITGGITYPSDRLPEGIVVHALNTQTKQVYNTSKFNQDAKYDYAAWYALSVPAGTYHVYAIAPSMEGRKAYHNQFIRCGIRVECTDTTIVEVPVTAERETADITVGDWWN
jgi:hypothetical protein